ncbi:MAG: NAD(P)-dependent oxidoreductase [Nitrospirota bacterium]|nr:NAD(P)-dependent oxidoreductase [Nitrospirota bacterium]
MGEPRRFLITGATGFVGSRLTRRLVADGHDCHVVVRPDSALDELSPVRDRLTVHVHDGTTGGMSQLMEAAAPEVVFHLAAYFVAEHRSDDIDRLIEANLRFGAQLVDALCARERPLLVNTGTSWQHFHMAAYRPVSLYAATKQAFEDLLAYYADATRLQVITLKLFDTYGPGDPRKKLLFALANAAQSGEQMALSGGEQHIDMVHVDDAVEAFVLAGQRLLAGEVTEPESYAVSSGTAPTLRELVALFERASGGRLNVAWGARAYRAREVMHPWRGGTPVPGWAPKVGLEQGLRDMVTANG